MLVSIISVSSPFVPTRGHFSYTYSWNAYFSTQWLHKKVEWDNRRFFFSLSLTSKRLLNICTTTAGKNDAQKQNTMWMQLNDILAWFQGFASRAFRLKKNRYDWICSTDTVQFATPSWCCFNPFSPYLQRVVKADIVNYSQDTMARTVNPPRSSMCALQWTPPSTCQHTQRCKIVFSQYSMTFFFFFGWRAGDCCKSVFSVFLCVGKMKNRLCGFKATLCSWAVHRKSNKTSVFF